MSRLKVPLSLWLAAAGLCLAVAACRKPKPAPSLEAVSAALQHTAEQNIPAPSLAEDRITLAEQPGRLDAQAAEIAELAKAAGGVSMRSTTPGGGTSILAVIPENNAAAFAAQARHEKAGMQPPAGSNRTMEVVFTKPAGSPPP